MRYIGCERARGCVASMCTSVRLHAATMRPATSCVRVCAPGYMRTHGSDICMYQCTSLTCICERVWLDAPMPTRVLAGAFGRYGTARHVRACDALSSPGRVDGTRTCGTGRQYTTHVAASLRIATWRIGAPMRARAADARAWALACARVRMRVWARTYLRRAVRALPVGVDHVRLRRAGVLLGVGVQREHRHVEHRGRHHVVLGMRRLADGPAVDIVCACVCPRMCAVSCAQVRPTHMYIDENPIELAHSWYLYT